MNNERYLYRGKRMDNREWITGYLYVTHLNEYEIGTYSFNSNIERLTQTVDPATIGQCTGLRDKNGELIFEGDLVRYQINLNHVINGVIVWDIAEAGFCVAESDDDFVFYDDNLWTLLETANDVEIVGNIHDDNPELLERSEER